MALIGLGKHKDSGVRMTALVIEAQTTEGLVKREKKIARWTKSRDPVQRQAAANSYGLLPADVCVPGLQRLARDDAFAVRHDALGALYRLRHPLALEVLIKVLGHGDRMTRDLAQRLLVGLTGERFGQSERTWSRWWIDHRVGFVFPGEKEVDRRLHEFKRKSSEGETAAAFFGLPVISQHVAFVLDTSSSMLADFSSSSR